MRASLTGDLSPAPTLASWALIAAAGVWAYADFRDAGVAITLSFFMVVALCLIGFQGMRAAQAYSTPHTAHTRPRTNTASPSVAACCKTAA